MPELTRRPTTGGCSDIVVRGVPGRRVHAVAEAVRNALRNEGLVVTEAESGDDALYTLEEVFGETHPGRAARGLRKSRGLKQKELAALLGVTPGNLSRMETGKRPIGKEMARRLGEALGANYKTFL